MTFEGKDCISMQDYSKEEIITILDAAKEVKEALHNNSAKKKFEKKHSTPIHSLLDGLQIATLFREVSTRTKHSFQSAALSTKAFVDGFSNDNYTSLKKGETWSHTVAMFASLGYDAIIMRSTTEGLPRWTSEYLEKAHQQIVNQHKKIGHSFNYRKPIIINGGDGKNQHPTQCLLDLFTIREFAEAKGKTLDGLSIALLNDLAYGRTVSSLMSIAPLFNFKLHVAYPDKRFAPQKHRLEYLINKGITVIDHGENFLEAMQQADFAYQSRPQKERIGEGIDFQKIKEKGQITRKMYDELGKEAPYLMHPLPIDSETFQEIHQDLDMHEKNITKVQSSNGRYVRIALLGLTLGKIKTKTHYTKKEKEETKTRIQILEVNEHTKQLSNPRTGFIDEGLVFDHIPKGMGRRLEGVLGFEKEKIELVSAYHLSKTEKDIIKIPVPYTLSQEQKEAIALLAPNITISEIKNGQVIKKYRPELGTTIDNLVTCGNEACVTNDAKEQVATQHHVEDEILRCHYCEQTDTVKKIYRENRFKYIEKKMK